MHFCTSHGRISVAHHSYAMNPYSSVLIQKPELYKLNFKLSPHFNILLSLIRNLKWSGILMLGFSERGGA